MTLPCSALLSSHQSHVALAGGRSHSDDAPQRWNLEPQSLPTGSSSQPWPSTFEHAHERWRREGVRQELKLHIAVGETEAQGFQPKPRVRGISGRSGTRKGGARHFASGTQAPRGWRCNLPLPSAGALLSVRASSQQCGQRGAEKRKAEVRIPTRPGLCAGSTQGGSVATAGACSQLLAGPPADQTARLPASTPAPAASRVRPLPRPLQVQSLSLSCP